MCLQEDLRRAGVAPGTIERVDGRHDGGELRRAAGRLGRCGATVRAVRFDVAGRSRMPRLVRAGEPGTDQLHDVLRAPRVADRSGGTSCAGWCGRFTGRNDGSRARPARRSPRRCDRFSRMFRRRSLRRRARVIRRLGIWGRDPVLPRAGYDRLLSSLVSGGWSIPARRLPSRWITVSPRRWSRKALPESGDCGRLGVMSELPLARPSFDDVPPARRRNLAAVAGEAYDAGTARAAVVVSAWATGSGCTGAICRGRRISCWQAGARSSRCAAASGIGIPIRRAAMRCCLRCARTGGRRSWRATWRETNATWPRCGTRDGPCWCCGSAR